MIRRPPRSTQSRSSAASDVYKRQVWAQPCRGTGRSYRCSCPCTAAHRPHGGRSCRHGTCGGRNNGSLCTCHRGSGGVYYHPIHGFCRSESCTCSQDGINAVSRRRQGLTSADRETAQVLWQHVSQIPRRQAWGSLCVCKHAIASSVGVLLWPGRPNAAKLIGMNLFCDEEVR